MVVLTCQDIEENSGHELDKRIHSVRYIGLDDVWTNDVHHNIELESVGEEDGNAEHAKGQLCQDVSLRKVKGDGCCSQFSILEISKEAHSNIKSSNGDHGSVKDSIPAKHVLGTNN